MSHSPLEEAEAGNAAYFRAWQQLVELLRSGKSFSGRERNCCLLNLGNGRFADASAALSLDAVEDGRAVVPIDWDFDGDLDVLLVNRNAPRLKLLRNDLPQPGGFLRVRLRKPDRGDAIGARAELYLESAENEPPHKLIRTVRAGEGFLTQSSSWLHFGLGNRATVERLVVTWPDGREEAFDDVLPNRHYEVVAGEGMRLWTRPAEMPVLEPHDQILPKSQTIRVPLRAKVPLAELRWLNADGTHSKVTPRRGARLVNFWATWCQPCAAELKQFAQVADQLQAANIDVLALNVDEFGGQQNDPQAAADALARFGYTGPAGRPTNETLAVFDAIRRAMTESRDWSLPTSFLINRQGKVAAIYIGPADVEQLQADIKQSTRAGTPVPFAGRWHREPTFVRNFEMLAGLLNEDGRPRSAQFYAEHALELDPESIVARRNLAVSHFQLGNLYRDKLEPEQLARAETHLRKAVELVPDDPRFRNNYGIVLAMLEKRDAAREQFEAALAIDPSDTMARDNLARLK